MLKGGWWWKSCGRGLNGLYLNDPQDLTARQGIYRHRYLVTTRFIAWPHHDLSRLLSLYSIQPCAKKKKKKCCARPLRILRNVFYYFLYLTEEAMCKFIYKQLVCSWYCRDRVVPLERMGLHSEEGYNDDQTEGRHASSLTIRILYFFFCCTNFVNCWQWTACALHRTRKSVPLLRIKKIDILRGY